MIAGASASCTSAAVSTMMMSAMMLMEDHDGAGGRHVLHDDDGCGDDDADDVVMSAAEALLMDLSEAVHGPAHHHGHDVDDADAAGDSERKLPHLQNQLEHQHQLVHHLPHFRQQQQQEQQQQHRQVDGSSEGKFLKGIGVPDGESNAIIDQDRYDYLPHATAAAVAAAAGGGSCYHELPKIPLLMLPTTSTMQHMKLMSWKAAAASSSADHEPRHHAESPPPALPAASLDHCNNMTGAPQPHVSSHMPGSKHFIEPHLAKAGAAAAAAEYHCSPPPEKHPAPLLAIPTAHAGLSNSSSEDGSPPQKMTTMGSPAIIPQTPRHGPATPAADEGIHGRNWQLHHRHHHHHRRRQRCGNSSMSGSPDTTTSTPKSHQHEEVVVAAPAVEGGSPSAWHAAASSDGSHRDHGHHGGAQQEEFFSNYRQPLVAAAPGLVADVTAAWTSHHQNVEHGRAGGPQTARDHGGGSPPAMPLLELFPSAIFFEDDDEDDCGNGMGAGSTGGREQQQMPPSLALPGPAVPLGNESDMLLEGIVPEEEQAMADQFPLPHGKATEVELPFPPISSHLPRQLAEHAESPNAVHNGHQAQDVELMHHGANAACRPLLSADAHPKNADGAAVSRKRTFASIMRRTATLHSEENCFGTQLLSMPVGVSKAAANVRSRAAGGGDEQQQLLAKEQRLERLDEILQLLLDSRTDCEIKIRGRMLDSPAGDAGAAARVVPQGEFLQGGQKVDNEKNVPPEETTADLQIQKAGPEVSSAGSKRFDESQVQFLEQEFQADRELSPARKKKLADALGMGIGLRQVAIWWHNRRARWKQKSKKEEREKLQQNFDWLSKTCDDLQDDYELLKRDYSDLLKQNSRILTRIQHLEDQFRSKVEMKRQRRSPMGNQRTEIGESMSGSEAQSQEAHEETWRDGRSDVRHVRTKVKIESKEWGA